MKPLFERVRYSICSEKIPPEFYGVRMVHLSDLHGAWFGKNHNVMIKAIESFHPDMVLMTGIWQTAAEREWKAVLCYAAVLQEDILFITALEIMK